MQKYRQSKLVRSGFMGLVLMALIIAVGLQPQQLVAMATSIRYQAVFAEAGGLSKGGQRQGLRRLPLGTVSDVELDQGARHW